MLVYNCLNVEVHQSQWLMASSHMLSNVSNLCVFPINVNPGVEYLLFASTSAFSLD